jgi:DNA-binding winged helix-turn-helix (wHTH) protein
LTYQFETLEVDDREFRLLEAGALVQVEPKVLRLLLYLIENRNRLVRKQELLDKVWQDAMVTENALTRVIGLLRKALNDDRHVPRFIETVPTAGYRFIARVTILEESPAVEPMTPTATIAPAADHEKGVPGKEVDLCFCRHSACRRRRDILSIRAPQKDPHRKRHGRARQAMSLSLNRKIDAGELRHGNIAYQEIGRARPDVFQSFQGVR